jgi:hypothetical protein
MPPEVPREDMQSSTSALSSCLFAQHNTSDKHGGHHTKVSSVILYGRAAWYPTLPKKAN